MRQVRGRGSINVPGNITEPPTLWRLAPLAIAVLVALTALDPMVGDALASLPGPLRAAARALTELGQSTWYLVPSGIIAIAAPWWARRQGWRARVAWRQVGAVAFYLFTSIGLTGLSSTLVKYAIGRARPSLAETQGYLTFRPIGVDPHWASFPSGHATVVFAVAISIGVIWPRARVPLFIVAALLASTRVLVGAHHLADVLAALLLALVLTGLIARAFARRRLALQPGPNGEPVLRGDRVWRILMPVRASVRGLP